MFGNLPYNVVMEFPSGRWGLVGRVELPFTYETRATAADVMGGRSYVKVVGEPAMTRKGMTFATREALIAFAEARGYEWLPDEGGPDGRFENKREVAG